MRARAPRWWILMLTLGVLLRGASVRADVLPEPTRPTWDENPPPRPDPPPEKQLAWVVAAIMMGLGGLTLVARSQRPRRDGARRSGERS